MIATIREANISDLGAIANMGEQFFEESGFSAVVAWDMDSFLFTATQLMTDGIEGTLLVAEQDGQIIGMAGSVLFPFFMNLKRKCSQELFWWCSPEYRTGIGSALLDELEADAMRRGASVFLSAQIAGQRDEAFKRLYIRRGYRPSENTFMKALH